MRNSRALLLLCLLPIIHCLFGLTNPRNCEQDSTWSAMASSGSSQRFGGGLAPPGASAGEGYKEGSHQARGCSDNLSKLWSSVTASWLNMFLQSFISHRALKEEFCWSSWRLLWSQSLQKWSWTVLQPLESRQLSHCSSTPKICKELFFSYRSGFLKEKAWKPDFAFLFA